MSSAGNQVDAAVILAAAQVRFGPRSTAMDYLQLVTTGEPPTEIGEPNPGARYWF